MRIGNCNATQGTGTSRAYLKFPVGSIPAGVHVTSADLAVYQTSQYRGGLGVAVNAAVKPSSWNATTLTLENRPKSCSTNRSPDTANPQRNWGQWNVSYAARHRGQRSRVTKGL